MADHQGPDTAAICSSATGLDLAGLRRKAEGGGFASSDGQLLGMSILDPLQHGLYAGVYRRWAHFAL